MASAHHNPSSLPRTCHRHVQSPSAPTLGSSPGPTSAGRKGRRSAATASQTSGPRDPRPEEGPGWGRLLPLLQRPLGTVQETPLAFTSPSLKPAAAAPNPPAGGRGQPTAASGGTLPLCGPSPRLGKAVQPLGKVPRCPPALGPPLRLLPGLSPRAEQGLWDRNKAAVRPRWGPCRPGRLGHGRLALPRQAGRSWAGRAHLGALPTRLASRLRFPHGWLVTEVCCSRPAQHGRPPQHGRDPRTWPAAADPPRPPRASRRRARGRFRAVSRERPSRGPMATSGPLPRRHHVRKAGRAAGQWA